MQGLPSSCYRLQLRNGVDFDAAAGLLPYLRRLGISHLYLSPVFAAVPGSTHGYDVIDPTRIEEDLGGWHGFTRLAGAARDEGLGIVLDIVPNHMAFSPENPWLRDVLRHGRDSRWWSYFDLRPDRSLALPMLEAPFGELLAEGAFSVAFDPDGPVLVHGPLRLPLAPGSLPATPPEAADAGAIARLHEAQVWRLCHWRTGAAAISHRRFFNITGLIGLRVEDEAVFQGTHSLVFDMVDQGLVAGLRMDHIDGLADPRAYLQRLHERLPGTPLWIEKILASGESLPGWPVCGTTGYVLARDVAQVLTGAGGVARIDTLYRRETGRQADFLTVMRQAKREVLETSLAAELWQLQELLSPLAQADAVAREYGPESWRQALIALIAHFDRYRSYLDDAPPRPADVAALETAAELAARGWPDRRPVDFLLACLLSGTAQARPLRLRFQQVAGAVMAKGQEDTAFYRYNRLLSANEVGADPGQPAINPAGFHRRMARRMEAMPRGLSLTSSHDTKRSEDARMRIAALSHHPEAMEALIAQAAGVEGAASVDPNLRWYLLQSLWALHPAGGDLAARLRDHAVKAMREAGEGTSWENPVPEFEAAGTRFAEALAARFATFPAATEPAARMARRLSLLQLAFKLALPGIPDIYQGCEVASHALTDPDNRRPVDFAALQRALDGGAGLSWLDRNKLSLLRVMLPLRRRHGALFDQGRYIALDAPPGCLAFRREGAPGTIRLAAAITCDLPAELAAAQAGERRIWPHLEAPGGEGAAMLAIFATDGLHP